MSLSTAQRFADERNTHRVILERALDLEHASNLLDLLELQFDQIQQRFMIGARTDTTTPGRVTITFVDNSIATTTDGSRWAGTRI